MNHNEDKNKRIYLYSHSPEAEKDIVSGEVAISTSGARRSDGTMMDMAKPLSFTLDELKEKTGRFVSYLESDARKLELPSFDVTSSNVDEHINDIGSFIKRIYDGLLDGREDGFFVYVIINALIVPFTEVLKKYTILFSMIMACRLEDAISGQS